MRRVLGILCMLLGLAMIGGALWLILENRSEEQIAGETAAQVLQLMSEAVQEETAASHADSTTVLPPVQETPVPSEMPVMLIDGREYIGYLEMPTISLSLPVMSDWSYPQLKIAPCRYHGSAYDDSMVVMAHNYDRHFGRLESLQLGDPVQFIDAQGNIFRYVVAHHEQLEKYDVEEMVSNPWDMTLFSCTYGGGARVTVRLSRVRGYE